MKFVKDVKHDITMLFLMTSFQTHRYVMQNKHYDETLLDLYKFTIQIPRMITALSDEEAQS